MFQSLFLCGALRKPRSQVSISAFSVWIEWLSAAGWHHPYVGISDVSAGEEGMHSYIYTSMQAGIQSLQIRASGVGHPGKKSSHHNPGNRDVVFPIESKAIYLSISRPQFFSWRKKIKRGRYAKSGKKVRCGFNRRSSSRRVETNSPQRMPLDVPPVHPHKCVLVVCVVNTHALGGRHSSCGGPFLQNVMAKHKWSACMNTVDHAQRTRTVMSRKLT